MLDGFFADGEPLCDLAVVPPIDDEREHFALATEEGLGLITWSPLAAGMLTGKITRDRRPPESRLAVRDMPFYRFYFNERAFGIVDVLVAAARDAGSTPAQLALAWQLAKPEVTSVSPPVSFSSTP